MGDQSMGILNVFKNNARLERNLERAKEVQERDGEFQGPDGKYVATFTRVSTGEKKDNEGNEVGWAVIELHVADVEGQEDFSGQKLPIIYFRFADNGEYTTAEEEQVRFFEALSQLGVDTTVSDDEFDDAVNEARGGLVNVSVKTNPNKVSHRSISVCTSTVWQQRARKTSRTLRSPQTTLKSPKTRTRKKPHSSLKWLRRPTRRLQMNLTTSKHPSGWDSMSNTSGLPERSCGSIGSRTLMTTLIPSHWSTKTAAS
jgi:hypothetical protein